MQPPEEQSETSYTLLERALDLGDERAWNDLYSNYMKYVAHVLLKIGVGPTDLDDVTQTAFVKLSKELRTYDRSKSKFRTWFYFLIKSSALIHFRKVKSDKTKKERYEHACAIEDSLQDESFETLVADEWEKFLATKAIERVEQLHRGKAIDVFKLGLQGKDTEEISKLTGLGASSIYTLRRRVKNSLMNEMSSLRRDLEWV